MLHLTAPIDPFLEKSAKRDASEVYDLILRGRERESLIVNLTLIDLGRL